MRLLLDTHALLWWIAGEPLGDAASDAIADPGNSVAVSAATAWEIAIKRSLGKLRFDVDLEHELRINGFSPLAVTVGHALRAGALEAHHRDPFDRMLVAQAQLEERTIVTRDAVFARYDVPVLAT